MRWPSIVRSFVTSSFFARVEGRLILIACNVLLTRKSFSKPVLADTYQVSLSLPPLAHLRPPTSPFGSAESYTISWSRNLLFLPYLANQTDFALAKEDGKGEWRVEVTFKSGEIRSKADWTSDAFAFTIV